ncbi:MAG: FkbM family methyltransferase [Thermoflexales bacterium]|nr:FkbM family methyltransferase [Thermoflexales bacterium]
MRRLRPYLRFVYTARSGIVRGLRRRGGLGFIPGRPLTAEERWLIEQSWQGKVVYDVGAYQGIFTMFFARAVGDRGHVVAFEPNPRSAEQLREHIALNGFSNVRVVQVALSDADGMGKLAVPKNAPEMSQLTVGSTGFVVPIHRLDTLLRELNLPVPSFIKIDVEGEELPVLRGSATLLREQRPVLLIEVHPRTSSSALWHFLNEMKYQTYSVESQRKLISPDMASETGNWHLLAFPSDA